MVHFSWNNQKKEQSITNLGKTKAARKKYHRLVLGGTAKEHICIFCDEIFPSGTKLYRLVNSMGSQRRNIKVCQTCANGGLPVGITRKDVRA